MLFYFVTAVMAENDTFLQKCSFFSIKMNYTFCLTKTKIYRNNFKKDIPNKTMTKQIQILNKFGMLRQHRWHIANN